MISGIFFIMIFTARFFIEFVKEEQEAFEVGMTLNMGQWLSIPFVIGGIALIIYAR
jgi:phosphatidylglycerol---prolipoprotein diacylglyceryl transferase